MNLIYPKVLEKIAALLKKQNFVIFLTPGKEAKSGSIVQFSTTNLTKKGKFAKNRLRFEIWCRKDGIKFALKGDNDRVISKYSNTIMNGVELKSFCKTLGEYSSEPLLNNIAEQIYQQFILNYEEEKINDLILEIESDMMR